MLKESKPKPERELLINSDYRRAVIYKALQCIVQKVRQQYTKLNDRYILHLQHFSVQLSHCGVKIAEQHQG